jgi:predicted CopG family antitoxin
MMAHKTITISDKAYEALARARTDNESFTKVILRLTSDRSKGARLVEFFANSSADEDLARSIERTMERTRKARLKPAEL